MQYPEMVLEQHIHYRKQNYYNRTRIKGANRILNLSIPVVRSKENASFHEREISYTEDWRKDHWKSFESAYRSAAYFEFYEDRFKAIFNEKFDRLLDLNLFVLDQLRQMLQMELVWSLSETYLEEENYEQDFRRDFDARGKRFPAWFHPVPYRQVFEGFSPDLSIMDLLFNMGPETRLVLRDSWVKQN